MKNLITLIILFSTIAGNSFAQQNKLNKDTSGFANEPIYILAVDSFAKSYRVNYAADFVDQYDIKNLEIQGPKEAEKKLDKIKAKHSLIKITMKKGIRLLTEQELLHQYGIPNKDKTLPVYVDSTLLYPLAKVMFQPECIKSVTIASDAETGSRYISIFLKRRPVLPMPEMRRQLH
ncbi:MAG: hypothetical protein JWR50_3235 [Mucilaginibacter sp.]|nr:hypothetical protein [Mucilaginibacter sp.]